jgi:hypothetical protein
VPIRELSAQAPEVVPPITELHLPSVSVPGAGLTPQGFLDESASQLSLPLQIADAAVAGPAMTAAPDTLVVQSDPMDSLAGGTGNGAPSESPLAWASLALTRRETLSGPQPEVAPEAAANSSAGTEPPELAVTDEAGTSEDGGAAATGAEDATAEVSAEANAAAVTTGLLGVAPPDLALLSVVRPAASLQLCLALCLALKAAQSTIENKISTLVVEMAPSAQGVVADTIGALGFQIINALMLENYNQVPGYIQQLATNTDILKFISQTVSGNAALASLPTDLAATIGNAAAAFVQNSFGNVTVATALVPVLKALNLPTNIVSATIFLADISDKGMDVALLEKLSPSQMQSAFVSFWSASNVQNAFGSAITDTINVLIGSASPSWAAPVNPNALADYVGQLVATAVLGAGNPGIPALTTTVSTATSTLLTAIGGTVSNQVGAAFVTFLSQSGVAGSLANTMVNIFVTGLGGTAPFPPGASLGSAAGVAVSSFVTSLLSTSAVPTAVGTFVTQLIDGIAGDSAVQVGIGQQVATMVTAALGGGALATAVGLQVGAAVQSLVANQTLVGALSLALGSLVPLFFSQQGVTSALASAAGQLGTAAVDGDLATVLPTVLASLEANSDIQAAVGVVVSDTVTQVLGDTAIWQAIDGIITNLISGLLNDTTVQTALNTQVAATVSAALGGGAFGDTVGAHVADAVVALVTNPAVDAGLSALVDTVFRDFFGATGVVPAFSTAASSLVLAIMGGEDPNTAVMQALATLATNTDVVAAVGIAVGGAVTQLLSDTAIWQAIDGIITNLISGLLNDTTVQTALNTQVAATVSAALGGGAFGDTVGAHVANAVVALVTNPAVDAGLSALVDTVFRDFFGATGVVPAFSTAASNLALAVLGGQDLTTALATVLAELGADADIQAAVGLTVGAAVTEVLSDTAMWQAIKEVTTSLVAGLIGDSTVQQALSTQVATTVSALLGGGALGEAVGAQIAESVVALVTDPAVGAGLSQLVDTLLDDFFGATGVVSAVADAASNFAVALLTGQDAGSALRAALAELQANADVQTGVSLAVGAGVTELLSDTAMWQAISAVVGSLVTNLVGDPTVQQGLNSEIASVVSGLLGGGTLGETVGAQVSAAVMALITDPLVTNALTAAVEAGISGLVGAPGVISAIAEAASQFAVSVLTGVDIDIALQTMLASLEGSPIIIAGLESAITAGLNVINTQLLSDAAVQQLLGTTLSTLFVELAGDPDVRTAIANFLGAPYGQIIASLLANPSVTSDFAQVLGTAVIDFLSYPGFNAALMDAVNEIAVAVLTGTDFATAWQQGLASLQANPAFVAAVNAIVPGLVDQIVSNPAVRQAMGAAAQQLIIYMLENLGISNALLDAVAGKVVNGTVTALLAQPATAALLTTIATNVLQGMPISEVTNLVVQAVLNEPGLQGAIGISVGYGIGSLFGDNVVGYMVGFAAGAAATITISIVAGLVRTFQMMFPGATAVADTSTTSLVSPAAAYFNNVFAAADGSYAMSAIVADQDGVEALGRGLAAGGLTLTDVLLSGITEEDSQFVDVTVMIDAPSAANDHTQSNAAKRAPLVVASRFRLDWMLQRAALPVDTIGVRRESVAFSS